MPTNLTPNLSAEDAQSALKIIQESAQRGTTLYRYYQSSPYFFLWALVWFLGFGLSDLFPNQVDTIWFSADLFGVIASLVLAKRKRTQRGIGQSVAWRLGGMAACIGLFAVCTLLVFEVRSGRQITCYFGLMVTCAYAIAGCWSGLRWLIAGVVMGVLTLFGYFMLPEHYNLWMGCVGGGTLALTGVWMRRV